MALSSTTTFDNFFTIGLSAYIREQVFDQVMTAHPIFAVLIGADLPELTKYALTSDIPPQIKQEKTALWEQPGTRIEMALEFGKNDTVQSFTPWQSLRSKQQQIVTRAIFDWGFYGGTVAISEIEDDLAAGNEMIPGVTNAIVQTENLKKVLVEKLAEMVFTGSGTYPDMYGLQAVIPDTATTGTIGGHDRSAKTWWQTKQAAVSAALDSDVLMNRMFLNCSRGNSKDTPNIIVTTQNVYEQVCEFTGDKQTFPQTQNAQIASLGFEHILFRGKAILTFDGNVSNASGARMYFINKQGIRLCIHPKVKMRVGAWTVRPDSFVKSAPTALAINLVPVKPQMLGVLTAITET